MRSLLLCLCLIGVSGTTAAAIADARPYFGKYNPWSRGCNGAAYLRVKTIEWRSTWSYCKPSLYEVIRVAPLNEPPYIAVRLKTRAKSCHFEVIELQEQQIGGAPKMWSISGYPSLEAYQKRDEPGWKDSASEERMPLNCPLDPRADPRR